MSTTFRDIYLSIYIPFCGGNRWWRNFVTALAVVSLLATSCDTKPQEEAGKTKKQSSTPEKPVDKGLKEKETKTDTLMPLKGDTVSADSVESPDKLGVVTEESDSSVYLPDSGDVAVEMFPIEDYSEPETSFDEYAESDAIFYEADDFVETERLLSSELVRVTAPQPKSPKDSVLSVIEERVSLSEEEVSDVIIVEKWLSPVHYKGYRFNKKKLILYGANKSVGVRIFYYTNEYYLGLNKKIYHIDERISYSPLETAKDSALVNYFNNYEHPL